MNHIATHNYVTAKDNKSCSAQNMSSGEEYIVGKAFRNHSPDSLEPKNRLFM